MSKIKGGKMMLFLNGKTIAAATNHTLTISAETSDISNKDEGEGEWSVNEVTLLSWTVSSENMFTTDSKGNGYDELFALMVAKTPINAAFAIRTEAPIDNDGWHAGDQFNHSGKVLITNLQLNAPNGDYATFTVDFLGVGPLS